MKGKQTVSTPPQFLSGWKEIANYLGKGVRTVQRYERDFGLPVRRPAGKPCGSVVATKLELDAWVMASPIREVFSLSRLTVKSDNAPYAAIKNGLQTMCQLRDQMAALRGQLEASVKELRERVLDLQGRVNPGSWHEHSTYPQEPDSLTKNVSDVTDAELMRRKAS
jgi:hypothetical protein